MFNTVLLLQIIFLPPNSIQEWMTVSFLWIRSKNWGEGYFDKRKANILLQKKKGGGRLGLGYPSKIERFWPSFQRDLLKCMHLSTLIWEKTVLSHCPLCWHLFWEVWVFPKLCLIPTTSQLSLLWRGDEIKFLLALEKDIHLYIHTHIYVYVCMYIYICLFPVTYLSWSSWSVLILWCCSHIRLYPACMSLWWMLSLILSFRTC